MGCLRFIGIYSEADKVKQSDKEIRGLKADVTRQLGDIDLELAELKLMVPELSEQSKTSERGANRLNRAGLVLSTLNNRQAKLVRESDDLDAQIDAFRERDTTYDSGRLNKALRKASELTSNAEVKLARDMEREDTLDTSDLIATAREEMLDDSNDFHSRLRASTALTNSKRLEHLQASNNDLLAFGGIQVAITGLPAVTESGSALQTARIAGVGAIALPTHETAIPNHTGVEAKHSSDDEVEKSNEIGRVEENHVKA